MYGGIESSRIIRAFQRWVPECYVRDYTANRGYLTVARGYKTMFDASRNTSHFAENVPARTLANLSPGYTPEKSIYRGMELVKPGWRQEMARARPHLTAYQAERIEKELGYPVFRRY
jgi:hypothetical protein